MKLHVWTDRHLLLDAGETHVVCRIDMMYIPPESSLLALNSSQFGGHKTCLLDGLEPPSRRVSFMATIEVRAIAGDVVLGPVCFEKPPCVSEILGRLQQSLELLPSQEIVLMEDSAILPDTRKLQGGSAADPMVLTMVTSKRSLQAIVWGRSTRGPQWSKVEEQLKRGIVAVASTCDAFAALTEDGSVITWGEGEEDDGGDSEGVLGLDQGVVQVVGNGQAFAAVKTGGELVAWGGADCGGKPSPEITAQLRDGVVSVARTLQAFAAVKENGEVVTWGDPAFGGDSSSTAGSLKGVISVVGTWGFGGGAFAALTDTGGLDQKHRHKGTIEVETFYRDPVP